MNVQELFRRLSFADLSGLHLGSEGIGTINEEDNDRMIYYANEALLRLHSRFVLRENDVLIQQLIHVTNYHFLKRFARTNEDPCPGQEIYILDKDCDPFEEDVIKITGVFTQNGDALPLNDDNHPRSLFTPQPNILQVPLPEADRVLAVTYQARHPLLSYGDLQQKIEIPANLEGALTNYIGHLVYGDRNGQENSKKASEKLARFEAICAENVINDLTNSSKSTSNIKFNQRGFV